MTAPTGTGSEGQTGTQSGGTDPQGTSQGNDPNANTGTGQQPQSGQQQGNEGTGDAVSRADYESLMRRMQASDQNNSKLQQQLKELQDKDLSEQERTKRDFEQAKADIAKVQQENLELRMQLAFVSDNTYQWHDPKAALKLADLSQVKVDDKGTVTGLKEALKTVADANPWMLKPKEPSEGNEGGAGSTTPPARSGVPAGTGNQSGGNNRTTLERRFPGLRSRPAQQ